MSEHASPNTTTNGPVTLETGLEAFQSSPEFSGPVEDLDGHDCNDHFAQIYETSTEKFEAAVPFVRHGLERGEQIAYVVDQSTKEDVRTALQDAGIDVEAALDSGALTFYSVEETYLRDGSFNPDEMIQFYADATAEATEEFEALRLVAEMSWIKDDGATVEELMEYESKINDLFDAEDVLAICQYDRDLFAPEVINNIVRTHPHLIYDGAACHNFYYTPPEELFGDDNLARENERMLQTLRDRTEAKTQLQQRDQFLRDLYHITAETTSFEEKLDALFDLGREQFDLDVGGIAKIDPERDYFEVETVSGDHDHLVPGTEYPLSETYCRLATDNGETAAVTDPIDAGFGGKLCYEQFGVQTYLGTHVTVDGDMDRTFWFLSTEPRETPVSDEERTFVDLMGQWVGYELERRQRERDLRERTEYLRALVETAPECIKTVAPDGTLLQMNAAGLDMVEAPDEAAVTGECVYDLIAPEDRERFREFNERVCSGERETLEFDIVGLDGTRRHMESHAAPLERPDGETVHVALTRDVTEQKEREAELRQTKTRFETVFKQSNDGIFLIDPDADAVVDVNPTAAELLGYTRDELTSLYLSDLHPDEKEQFHAFLDEVLETGSAWSEDLHCRTKDGRDLPVEGSASAITLDGRDLVLANVRHIEERKIHERYQRELYDIVADSGASFEEKLDGLLDLGRERFDLENGYFNRLDTDADEFEVVAAIGPHDKIEPGAVDVLSGTFCETHLDSSVPLAAANVTEAGLDALPAYDEYGLEAYFAATVHVGGDRYGTLCFASETPRDKPFTEAERTFLDLMAQCVSYELERDRREAQLEQKTDRLESFASLLAHELRNPVAIGQIYSQQLPDGADAEAVEYVADAFDRIENMVDVLLVLTRGREAIGERTPLDLANVARKAWDTVEASDAEIDVDFDRTIEADETYVRHLFRNLLENAVEHGGEEVTVTVGDLDDGFYVADDGPGIPPEDRDAVFHEGYTTTADNGGTGLGLAFVQKLAEVYEWDVRVTDSEGGGARFEFRGLA